MVLYVSGDVEKQVLEKALYELYYQSHTYGEYFTNAYGKRFETALSKLINRFTKCNELQDKKGNN